MERPHVVNTHEDDDAAEVLNPKRELKCSLIRTTLKSFVIQHVARYYQAAAIRVMLPTTTNIGVWQARQKLEERFATESSIAGFFSCGTALVNQTKNDQKQDIAGISFWVMFDWPEMGIDAYESHLTRIATETGLETVHCKAVKGRGKKFFLSPFFYFQN